VSYFDNLLTKKRTVIGGLLVKLSCRQALKKLRDFEHINSVLEIGPGKGDFGLRCLEEDIAYRAIECNENVCNNLRASGLDVTQSLVPPFPEDIPAADCVVAMHVLEHMSTLEQAIAFIEGVRAKLKEGGLVLIVSPDIRYSKEWFWAVNYSHNYVTSVSRISQLLNENGFDIELATNRCSCFFYPWSHLVWILSKFIPYRLLERLSGRNYVKKSVWTNARITLTPKAFVIARKKTHAADI